MSKIEELMREWFALKDEQTAVKKQMSEFHKTYECQNYRSNTSGIEQQCIYRSKIGQPVDDMCGPCSSRHQYYLNRLANARKRTGILNKVRHLLKQTNTPAPQDGSETPVTKS